MKTLNQFKAGVIHKGVNLIDIVSSTKKFGHIIYILDDNNFPKTKQVVKTSSIKKLLDSQEIDTSNYRNIWHPNKIDYTPVIQKKLPFNISKYRAKLKESEIHLIGPFKDVESYRNKNLIYDLTTLFTYYNYYTSFNGLKKLKGYHTLLENAIIDPKFSSYKVKIILIPIDMILSNFNEQFKNIMAPSTRIDNDNNIPISFINRFYFEENLPGSKLVGVDEKLLYVFYNFVSDEFFYVDAKDPIPFTKFKNRISYMFKFNNDRINELTKDELETGEKAKELETVTNYLKPLDQSIKSSIKREKLIRFTNKLISEFKSKNTKVSYLITPDNETNLATTKIEYEINSIIEKNPDATDDELLTQLDSNEEIKKHLMELVEAKNTVSEVNQRIIQKSKEKQDSILINGVKKQLKDMTISEIMKEGTEKSIIEEKINDVKLLDESFRSSRLRDFEKSYNNNQLEKDYYRIFTAFNNDKEFPLFIKKFEIIDSYDGMSYKKTYSVTYTDKANKSFKLSIDIPTIIDDKFIVINNSKKVILKQLTALPLSKTDPDEVYLTTNYNKFQIFLTGNRFNEQIEMLRKVIEEEKDFMTKNNITFERGSKEEIKLSNGTIEFNQLAKSFTFIRVGQTIISFDKHLTEEIVEHSGIVELDSIPEELKPIAVNKKENLIYYQNIIDGSIYCNQNIINEDAGNSIKGNYLLQGINNITDLVLHLISKKDSNIYSIFMNKKTGKKFMHSTVSILNRKVPLVILLGFYHGLFELLSNYKIDFKLSTKKLDFENDKESLEWRLVPFSDTKLYYRNTPQNNLLLNGLLEMNTKDYLFSAFSGSEPYLDYFEENLNTTKNISKGFRNTLNRMIDPITEEVLADLKYPTDIVGVLMEANTMLANTNYKDKNDPTSYRIRGTESIASYLYKVLADQYNKYISSSDTFTVPKDKLIKILLESKVVEDYSVLNPLFEIDQTTKATMKGNAGLNSEHAYTPAVRAYHKNMQGLFGNYVSSDGNAGIQKFLSYNPKLKGVRGYIDATIKDRNASELLMTSELVSPFTASRSDPPRQAMTTKQSSHIVPVAFQDYPLIGSGIEKTIPYVIGSDFIVTAKMNGKIAEIDNIHEVMIINYEDNTNEVINIGNQISKNSSSGFYTENTLIPQMKVGDTFKKDQIIAKNNTFFKGDKDGVLFSTGTLAKVAMVPLGETLEDSSLLTEEFSRKLSSTIIMKETASFSVNTNISKMVKIGDHIQTSDLLILFETSSDDSEGIALLDKMGIEMQNDIADLSVNTKRTKYSGIVEDIKIYYNQPIEEFTPSLQKIIKDYVKRVKGKKAKIDSVSTDSPPNIILPSVEKINSNRILNNTINGILIEFYIKHETGMSIGDKVTMQTASKTIVSTIIPDDEEPYSSFRPEENIDVIFSPLSVVSRMTMDLVNIMTASKVLIELKRKVDEIYNS